MALYSQTASGVKNISHQEELHHCMINSTNNNHTTRMNSAIQFIVLLACISICTSASIKNCHCVKTVEAVRPKLIAHVREHKPRPYCSKREVIVILKDKSKLCLDPDSQFTKRVLETKNKSSTKST